MVALLALLSLPLFFSGLGSTYLWQDEAQTALLGRSVLRHGVPMVGAGADSLSAVTGADAGLRGIYFQISWLQAYLTALSFQWFGESSWSARLPFALAGWMCVPLAAWAVRRIGGGETAARMAALLTATSVPFIVCSRQCRYYALTAMLVLIVTGTYAALLKRVRLQQRSGLAPAAFATAAIFLVLSFDVTAIGLLGATAFHWIVAAPGTSRRASSFWVPWATAALVLVAWTAVSLSAPIRHTYGGLAAVPSRLWHGIPYYASQIDAHVLPLPVILIAAGLGLFRQVRGATILAAVLLVGGLGGAMLSPFRFFRYLVPVLPLILVVASLGLAVLWSRGRLGRLAAGVAIAALVTSTAPHVLSHALLASLARATGIVNVRERSLAVSVPLAQMIRELRDPPRGPIATAVEFLNARARAGEVIVTTYGELPLKFHTTLTVFGGETAQLPPADMRVTWIWPRHRTKVYPAERAAIEWVERELAGGSYHPITLDATDRRWENREDPEEHVFTNPGPEGPRVVLYRAGE